MNDIYFACICATYNRPELLPEAVESFLRQTYKNAELIILDDAGQYENQQGERWKLHVHHDPFRCIGAKHDYSIRNLISGKVNAIAIWDDDDISLPNRLEVLAECLKDCDLALPWMLSQMNEDGNVYSSFAPFPIHNGAYRLEAYMELGGYPHQSDMDEDKQLWHRFLQHKKRIKRVWDNIYLVRHHREYRHSSYCNSEMEYKDQQILLELSDKTLVPFWKKNYDEIVKRMFR